MHYVIVDIETTGGSPKNSKITEIAIYKHDGNEIIDQFETLINPEISIPEFIVNLTGINDQMVKNSPKFHEISDKIIEFTEGCIFVAHNVSFDYGVLRHEFRKIGHDFRRKNLCTVIASRNILPGFDSYSLGKLTRALGIELIGRHRAGGDAFATAKLFTILMEKSTEKLEKHINEDLNPQILHPNLDLAELDEIPDRAGVYKFYNEFNQLIYVGKSKFIRRRIEQHLKNSKTPKGENLLKEITRVEYELTGSEFISTILENTLLKAHQPSYNTAVRKTRFSHGLYQYFDDNGYIHLFIGLTSKMTDEPIIGFISKKDAIISMVNWTEEYQLCKKLCDLDSSNTFCKEFETKKCKGACVQEESSEFYNLRVQKLIDELLWSNSSFYIIENGRQKGEKSLVLIENGRYIGHGFAPFHFQYTTADKWKRYIEFTEEQEDRDFRTNLRIYIKNNPHITIVKF